MPARVPRSFALALAISSSLAPLACSPDATEPGAVQSSAAIEEVDHRPPSVFWRDAPVLRFPGPTDSNSPAHWSGDTLFLFNSEGDVHRSSGADLASLGATEVASYRDTVNGYRWIEATWKDDDGTLYGWYHNEPRGLCPENTLTAPRIGAARSHDDGATWENLGIVLDSPHALRCDAKNTFFAGGIGDPSVIRDGEYVYFFASTYAGDVSEQGVAVARMAYADRDEPVGKVWKWRDGGWAEPGLTGHVSPIFVAKKGWASADLDAFWGASISYNTHLNRFVVLMNRATGGDWKQGGIYASYSADITDPSSWTAPVRIASGEGSRWAPYAWYPQAFGTNAAERETDKLVGRTARFFLRGESTWEIDFARPDQDDACRRRLGNLHGVVRAGRGPRGLVTVSAWGSAHGDYHETKTNAFGYYAFEHLRADSAYNVVVNARFQGGAFVVNDPSLGYVEGNNLDVAAPGADCWTRQDFAVDER